MDPITGAIVAAVLWFFGRSIISVVIVLIGLGIGALIAAATDKDGLAIPFVVLGYLAAIAWELFAIIQAIIEVVRIVELVSA